jgi:acetyl-CoA carboxylase carboxyl transferase subunit beta
MPVRLPFRPRRDAYRPDLWTKCPDCAEMLFNKQLEKTLRVCPNCGHHFRISAKSRIEQLVDGGSFVERDGDLQPVDALGFVDLKSYPDRLMAAQLATGLRDAAVWGLATMGGKRVSLCVMDFGFIGGSMGAVVGEKVARAGEAAVAERIPLIIVSSSGGARMQEGTYSLMQLAKTMGVVERVRAARVPFISVLTDPTTGGVFASFAAVGDVNIAEPNAIIKFAGERVSAGTIGDELPPGYARTEFWLSHGFVDRIVTRPNLRGDIIALLSYLAAPPENGAGEPLATPGPRSRSLLSALTEVLGGESGDLRNGEASRSRGEAPHG